MSEKVVLPKEVADELQGLRNQGWTDFKIVHHIYDQWNHVDEETPMAAFAKRHNSPFLRALADGFQVEQTPEDTLRKYYNLNRPQETETKDSFNIKQSTSDAIVRTLEILNIKIEGVNV